MKELIDMRVERRVGACIIENGPKRWLEAASLEV